MKGMLDMLRWFLISLLFSYIVSHDESKALYQTFGINNSYGSLLLDVMVNFILVIIMVHVVAKFKIFDYYRQFVMKHFNRRIGNLMGGIVFIAVLFLMLLVLQLILKPEYAVTFAGFHLLFASIFLIDCFMLPKSTEQV